MKKLIPLFMVVFVGCASINVKSNKQDFSLLTNQQRADLLKKKTGLTLNKSESKFYPVEYAPEEMKKFSQKFNMMPGDNLADLFNQEELKKGDLLLGIDNKSVNADLDLQEYFRDLKDRPTLTFYSPSDDKIKNYVVSSREVLNKLVLSKTTTKLATIKVSSVEPNSWADKEGYEAGDSFIEGYFANGEGYKYMLLGLPAEKVIRVERGKLGLTELSGVIEAFLQTFSDKEALIGTEGVSLQKESYLKLAVINDNEFKIKTIHRTRFLGLGVQFDCPARARKCGNRPAEILTVFPNSPGARVGFQLHDLVESIDGEKINGTHEALEKIRSMPVGEVMKMKVRRGMDLIDLEVARDLVIMD
ncbi:PDZ domain-containing protein [Candidatus Wolfebacteria bacterium]|nr:PDZ domain-containing protein [Candidatus Wolfebacteria bacterium]